MTPVLTKNYEPNQAFFYNESFHRATTLKWPSRGNPNCSNYYNKLPIVIRIRENEIERRYVCEQNDELFQFLQYFSNVISGIKARISADPDLALCRKKTLRGLVVQLHSVSKLDYYYRVQNQFYPAEPIPAPCYGIPLARQVSARHYYGVNNDIEPAVCTPRPVGITAVKDISPSVIKAPQNRFILYPALNPQSIRGSEVRKIDEDRPPVNRVANRDILKNYTMPDSFLPSYVKEKRLPHTEKNSQKPMKNTKNKNVTVRLTKPSSSSPVKRPH